jgi:hypothetical protein
MSGAPSYKPEETETPATSPTIRVSLFTKRPTGLVPIKLAGEGLVHHRYGLRIWAVSIGEDAAPL